MIGTLAAVWAWVRASIGTLRDIASLIALVVSAFWGWKLFVERRRKYPRAAITHAIFERPAAEDTRLVRVKVNVANQGEVLLRLGAGCVRIYQIEPFDEDTVAKLKAGGDPVVAGEMEAEWPTIAERVLNWRGAVRREIEPGEGDELNADFFIHSSFRTVMVYSYIKNDAKPGSIGWNTTSIHELGAVSSPEKARTR